MKGLLLALAISATGALALGAGSPANAMTAGAVSGMSDIAKPDTLTQKVWYDRGYCWEFPWRCRHRYYRPYYGYGYYRPYYRPYYSYGYYPWWGYRHHYRRYW
jgi:hypothetical protein